MRRSAPSRVPWLTATVALVTAAGLLVQELVPGTLSALQRSPAATWEEPWRWVTALVVQDGWFAGGVFNIAALVVAGALLEQRVARSAWLVAYVGAGLAGQVFGHYWQPVGGGDSVADCGLVGLLVVVLAAGPADRWPGSPPWTRFLPLAVCTLAALLLLASRDLHGGALVTALAVSVVAVRVGAIDIL